jgi:hypothetical protein
LDSANELSVANQVGPVRRFIAAVGILFSSWLLYEGISSIPHGGVMGGPIILMGLFGGALVLFVACLLILLGRR